MSVTGERVRMAHIMRGVVDDVDMGEADEADDEETERHGHQGLGQPADLANRDRQTVGLRMCHHCSPSFGSNSTNFLAISRLVRWKFRPTGRPFCAILIPAAALNAVEIAETVLWRRLGPEERSERPAMHGAESGVIFDRENQRIDLRMPAHSIL